MIGIARNWMVLAAICSERRIGRVGAGLSLAAGENSGPVLGRQRFLMT